MVAHQDEQRTRGRHRGRLLWTMIGGAATGLLAVSIGLWLSRPSSLPLLTSERLARAIRQWQESGPANYRILVVVEGPQPGAYRVEVRQGIARHATLNGHELRDARTLGTWSVAGMFANLERDCPRQAPLPGHPPAPSVPADGLSAESSTATPAVPPADHQLLLRCRFDERYGYPAEYQRFDWGGQPEIRWHVLSFDVLTDAAAGPHAANGLAPSQLGPPELEADVRHEPETLDR